MTSEPSSPSRGESGSTFLSNTGTEFTHPYQEDDQQEEELHQVHQLDHQGQAVENQESHQHSQDEQQQQQQHLEETNLLDHSISGRPFESESDLNSLMDSVARLASYQTHDQDQDQQLQPELDQNEAEENKYDEAQPEDGVSETHAALLAAQAASAGGSGAGALGDKSLKRKRGRPAKGSDGKIGNQNKEAVAKARVGDLEDEEGASELVHMTAEEARMALESHLERDVTSKRNGPPNPNHSAFTPETYSMIVAHLAATRHAWKGLKVCDELNSMDSSHTPMSYLSYIRLHLNHHNLESDVMDYRAAKSLENMPKASNSADVNFRGSPSIPSVSKARKRQKRHQPQMRSDDLQSEENPSMDVQPYLMNEGDQRILQIGEEYDPTFGVQSEGEGDHSQNLTEAEYQEHHQRFQAGLQQHAEFKEGRYETEDQKSVKAGNEVEMGREQEGKEDSNYTEAQPQAHPTIEEQQHQQQQQEPADYQEARQEGVKKPKRKRSKVRGEGGVDRPGRNTYSKEDQIFMIDHLARTSKSWTGLAVCKDMVALNDRHTVSSYQTYLRDNISRKRNLAEGVRLYRLTNPEAVPEVPTPFDPDTQPQKPRAPSQRARSKKTKKLEQDEDSTLPDMAQQRASSSVPLQEGEVSAMQAMQALRAPTSTQADIQAREVQRAHEVYLEGQHENGTMDQDERDEDRHGESREGQDEVGNTEEDFDQNFSIQDAIARAWAMQSSQIQENDVEDSVARAHAADAEVEAEEVEVEVGKEDRRAGSRGDT